MTTYYEVQQCEVETFQVAATITWIIIGHYTPIHHDNRNNVCDRIRVNFSRLQQTEQPIITKKQNKKNFR